MKTTLELPDDLMRRVKPPKPVRLRDRRPLTARDIEDAIAARHSAFNPLSRMIVP